MNIRSLVGLPPRAFLEEKMNLALIVIDSLRFDTTQVATTPNFRSIFQKFSNDEYWVQVGANATYTLPAHIALLKDGRTPCRNQPDVPGPYNREKEILFRPQLAWREKDATYPTPEAPNIVKGFEKLGYRTVGIGGVHWFNTAFQTSAFWGGEYFQEFYWRPDFADDHPDGFENQLGLCEGLFENHRPDVPVFFFINIASCHFPYRRNERSVQGQARCLEYIDAHIQDLLQLLPLPCHVLIMADHGECFGEDGLWGHAIYHPKIMEIPMKSFIMRQ
jgi:hypothetical protein